MSVTWTTPLSGGLEVVPIIVNMTPGSVVLVVGGSAAAVYGLLDLVIPATTIRWQVRSTARAGGARKAVGENVQRAVGMNPKGESSRDPSVLRRVRLIGSVLVAIGALVAGLGVILWH